MLLEKPAIHWHAVIVIAARNFSCAITWRIWTARSNPFTKPSRWILITAWLMQCLETRVRLAPKLIPHTIGSRGGVRLLQSPCELRQCYRKLTTLALVLSGATANCVLRSIHS